MITFIGSFFYMHLSDFEKYLSLEKKYSVHTVSGYLSDLKQFNEFLVEQEVALDDAPYIMVRQWVSELMDAGLTSRSINRKTSSLKTYYKYLRAQGVLQTNIMTVHKSLKTAKKVQIPFSQLEIDQIFEMPVDLESFVDVRNRVLIELLYATGMRRAELIGLKISSIDLSNGQVRIIGKRNKERLVPLLKGSLKMLLKYLELRKKIVDPATECLFITESGRPIYNSLVYRIVSGHFKKVSLKVKVSPHVLRHTFATHLLDQGADLNAVKELLGHASLASTQVYTHTSMQALKDVHRKAHPRNK